VLGFLLNKNLCRSQTELIKVFKFSISPRQVQTDVVLLAHNQALKEILSIFNRL